MAFQQALSGLNAASKAIDVISNNVANGSTVGFKMSNSQFADVYAASLNGGLGGVQIGMGTQVGKVAQAFTQGNITSTSNPLDVAINGAGFFQFTLGDGTVAYSRNGQLQIDKTGYLVNAQGGRLSGYPADSSGLILPAKPSDIHIDAADLLPNTTTSIRMGLNLDSRAAIPTTSWTAGTSSPDPRSYNSSTAVVAYDSLGNAHTMTMYFVKTGSGQWDLYTQLDGQATSLATAASPSLTFDSAGQLSSASNLDFSFTAATLGTGASDLNFSMELEDCTQYGSSFGVNTSIQDGYASGKLSGITIAADGVVQGRYSNGQARALGQVVLANFPNPQGLLAMGSNLWAESPMSGPPLVGTPQSGSLGTLSAGAIEESNVDLTAELVNMITAQRNYQANSQSIKTQDQIMQTLLNLR